MTEDQGAVLFGDVTIAASLAWVSVALVFLGMVVLLWKKITAFVNAVNTLIGLDRKLKAIDEKLDKMPGLESTLERVRAQVENDHRHPDGTPIIMRDEQDRRHEEIMTGMTGLQKQIGRVEDRVDGQGQQLATHLAWSAEWSREQERADRELADRIEDTMDPRKDP
ncbi:MULTISPECIES: hypothetical protein [unclassified Leucobacter]|uniref:hypothetical protein n=1 Tax=unclassified Leucobacter TaxID=2621730 RepID=UPI0006224466|nr:hypothetical protein [Leucobacter sp. Ag1]KKI20567.1 hypothetical protein XM48_07575 [Leucobacter sp. Ag1]